MRVSDIQVDGPLRVLLEWMEQRRMEADQKAQKYRHVLASILLARYRDRSNGLLPTRNTFGKLDYWWLKQNPTAPWPYSASPLPWPYSDEPPVFLPATEPLWFLRGTRRMRKRYAPGY